MKKLFLFFVAIVFLIVPITAFAAEFRSNSSGSVSLPKDEKAKNLYIVGSSVESEGEISGDLVAAGTDVNINSKVETDLIAAGATVTINGIVGQNARIAGGTVTYKGKTGQDLLVGANIFNLDKNSNIGGDLIVAGSNVDLEGSVNGNAKVAGGDVIVNGVVNGNVDVRQAKSVQVGDQARINGKLTYAAPEQANISSSAVISGGVSYQQISTKVSYWSKIGGWSVVYDLLGAIFTLLVLVYLLPKWADRTAKDALVKPWSKLGWGLFSLIVVPLVAIFLIAMILGLKLGFIIAILYLLMLLLASVFSPLILGYGIFKLFKKDKPVKVDWATIIIGVLVLTIAKFVPIVGWLFIFLVFLFALGEITYQVGAGLQDQMKS